MKKRRAFLAVLFVILLFSASAAAASSRTCGDHLTWSLDRHGHLSITGTGEMTDWTYNSLPPWGVNIASVTIGPGVTRIGNYAFYRCDVLKEVQLPSTLTALGSFCFTKCENLPGISIPNGVETIEYGVFIDCFSLTEVTLPESVVSLQPGAFSTNWNYTPVMQAIHADGNNPVYYDIDGVLFARDGQVLVRFPDGREGTYTVPEGTTRIGYAAFQHCRIRSIVLPEGVTVIERGAFQECYDLEEISLPESLSEIGSQAFLGVRLDRIVLPRGVKTIGEWAFGEGDCKEIVFAGKPESIASNAFGRTRGRIIAYYNSSDGWEDHELADYGGKVLWVDYAGTSISTPSPTPAPSPTPVPVLAETAVKAVWEDSNDQMGKRPGSLKVSLSNGPSVVLNGSNGWTATLADLPKYAEGEEILYTWTISSLPDGYTLAGSRTEGNLTTLICRYTAFSSAAVRIGKVDADTGKALSGAQLRILDRDGNVVEAWTSDGSIHQVTGLAAGAEYTLQETGVPKGYTAAGAISFRVDEEGRVTGNGSLSEEGVLMVKNAPVRDPEPEKAPDPTVPSQEMTIRVEWTGIGTAETLPDVTLDIYRVLGDGSSAWVKKVTWPAKKILAHGGVIHVYNLRLNSTCYAVEQVPAGYTVRYQNIGTRAEETDRAYSNGTIRNHRIPRTGDARPMDGWAIAACAAVLGMFLVLLKEKRR